MQGIITAFVVIAALGLGGCAQERNDRGAAQDPAKAAATAQIAEPAPLVFAVVGGRSPRCG